MVLIALTTATAAGAFVVAMVVLVVVTALLETRTAAPPRRSTALAVPRRIGVSMQELPEIDLVAERRRYDRRIVQRLVGVGAPATSVADAGSVSPPGTAEDPPTEQVPIVVIRGWVADDGVHPRVAPLIDALVPDPPVAAAADVSVAMALSAGEAVREREPEPAGDPVEERRVQLEAIRRGLVTAALDAVRGVSPSVGAAPNLPPRSPQVPPTPTPTTVFVASVESRGGARVVLGAPGADRELIGVLFAAYVRGGFRERSRVTGWVTPCGDPESVSLPAGTSMRGRPARIAELLDLDEADRNWVTLDQSVDIERGLRRRKPADEVLKGVLWWWLATTDERARVPAAYVGELLVGLEAVESHVGANPMRATVTALVDAVREAAGIGAGLRIEALPAASLSLVDGAGVAGATTAPATGTAAPADRELASA